LPRAVADNASQYLHKDRPRIAFHVDGYLIASKSDTVAPTYIQVTNSGPKHRSDRNLPAQGIFFEALEI